jgi:hypothetical protein
MINDGNNKNKQQISFFDYLDQFKDVNKKSHIYPLIHATVHDSNFPWNPPDIDKMVEYLRSK